MLSHTFQLAHEAAYEEGARGQGARARDNGRNVITTVGYVL